MTEKLSIVPTSASVQLTISDIKNFRTIVREALNRDVDYGVIPHTVEKPTLYKSGAEKIAHILNANAAFTILDQYASWDSGVFGYTVKCSLSGISSSEGLGACSTLENKYVKQNGFSLQNTVLKMAKKRAFIDAVLTASGLSDMFTQDIEDMDIPENEVTPTVVKENDIDDVYICSLCGAEMNGRVNKYSIEKLGRPLCYSCQKNMEKTA